MKKNRILYVILAALLLAGAFFLYQRSQQSGELLISKQPESVVVSYPEGAVFTVEVNKPKLVKSYQWIMTDVAGNVFELGGVTAKTKKLVIPSTTQGGNTLNFYCIITDKNDQQLISEVATLEKDNSEVNKPVLYLGEYAVEPGSSLDLSKIDLGDGSKLGSGIITFDGNGTDITLDNVVYDNSKVSCDYSISDNVGLVLDYYQNDKEEYNVTFIGDNVIYNSYYDADYNASGIPFDFMIYGDGVNPLINLVGDGNLTITNGTYALRAIGDLMIDIDIAIRHDKGGYGDGIVGKNIMVNEGKKIDMDIYGSAFYAQGNLYLKGADLTIRANAPHISMGMAAKNILNVSYELMMDRSNVDVKVRADYDVCQSVGMLTGISCGGDLKMYDSTYSFDIGVIHNDDIYVSNISGISAKAVYCENSDLNINIDSQDIFSSFGMYAEENIELVGGSADVRVNTNGKAFGIAPELDFSADDCNVTVSASSYDDYGDLGSYGIMCENLVIRILDKDIKVTVRSENGMAVGCNLHDEHNTPAAYVNGYRAENVYLRENTVCSLPADNVISLGSIETGDLEDFYLYLETYYDLNDLSAPAKEVVFTAGE